MIVWKFAAGDEERLSRVLPLDGAADERPRPWIQHVMPVNSMNFCAFTMAPCQPGVEISEAAEVLVATPNAIHLDGVSRVLSLLCLLIRCSTRLTVSRSTSSICQANTGSMS